VKQKVRQWIDAEEVPIIDFNFSDIKVTVVEDKEAENFLAAFHYLGKLAGRVKLGAFLDDKLIAVSVWSAPTRHETATRLGYTSHNCLELRRFVIHDSYHKKNFGSYVLSRMEKQIPSDIKMLVSFADTGMGHDGTLYKATNWTLDGVTEPSFFYVDSDGYVMLKKTLYNQARKMHMKEADYAALYNYEKVKTPPKNRFIKRLK
jgi:hypothetical protein